MDVVNINDLSTLIHEGSYWNDNKIVSPLVCAQKNRQTLKKSDDEWSNSTWQDKVVNDDIEQEKIVKQYRQNLKLFRQKVNFTHNQKEYRLKNLLQES